MELSNEGLDRMNKFISTNQIRWLRSHDGERALLAAICRKICTEKSHNVGGV